MGYTLMWAMKSCRAYVTVSPAKYCWPTVCCLPAPALAALLERVTQARSVPMVAVVSAGQRSIRQAVQQVLPTTPDQRCHFHDLCEAAKPRYEADHHAKKALKKRVRGVRPACTPTRDSKRPRSRPHPGLLSRRALTPAHPQDGQTLRQTLEGPQQRRVRHDRFRRAPPTSLAALEKDLLQLILPS